MRVIIQDSKIHRASYIKGPIHHLANNGSSDYGIAPAHSNNKCPYKVRYWIIALVNQGVVLLSSDQSYIFVDGLLHKSCVGS